MTDAHAEPDGPPEESAHAEFVRETLENLSAWVRFADAKAGAVLVLGLLLADALANAGDLHRAYSNGNGLGVAATVLLWIGLSSPGDDRSAERILANSAMNASFIDCLRGCIGRNVSRSS